MGPSGYSVRRAAGNIGRASLKVYDTRAFEIIKLVNGEAGQVYVVSNLSSFGASELWFYTAKVWIHHKNLTA